MKYAPQLKSFFQIFPWKRLLPLTAAGIINAIGVILFLSPVNLYDSGLSGTAMLLNYLTPNTFTLSLFLVILNVPFFVYGCKRQGVVFTVSSIYGVLIYSLASYIIISVLPVDVTSTSPLAGNDLLLCAVFGGAISGIGSGCTIRFGGALDGIEVMAVIFAKKFGMTVGSFVMCYNVLLYMVCGAFTENWQLPLYSIITYMVGVKTIDFIVEGLDKAKSAMIITTKADDICEALSQTFGSGVTKISASGYYSSEEKTIIYFVVNRFQITRMKDVIASIDPAAFVTIAEVTDVLHSSIGGVQQNDPKQKKKA